MRWNEGGDVVVRATRDGVEPLDGLGDLRYVLAWAMRRGRKERRRERLGSESRPHCLLYVLASGGASEADWARLRRVAQEEGFGTLCVYEQQSDGRVEGWSEALAPEGDCDSDETPCNFDGDVTLLDKRMGPHPYQPPFVLRRR